MQIEDQPTKGKRAQLTVDELDMMYGAYDEDLPAQIALRLMGMCGLRTKEVIDVEYSHVRRADTEGETWKLTVPEGKGEDGGKWRETALPSKLKDLMSTYRLGYGIDEGEQLVQKRLKDGRLKPATRRSVQHWTVKARERLAEEHGDEQWHHVSAHDLRRSWANTLLEGGASTAVVMQLGGWSDYETFREHYLGTLSDEAIANEVGSIIG